MSDKLTIKLEYAKPVELADISMSLYAVASDFSHFSNQDINGLPGTKLYLHSVENGSFVADLVAFGTQVSVFTDQVQVVSSFIDHTKTLLSYLLGESKEKPDLDRKQLEHIRQFMEPVAKDTGGQWIISHNGQVNITVNYQQANAVQNAAERELLAMRLPVSGLHEGVVLVFKQTRTHPETGNRAVIESISKAPVKTDFADRNVHDLMLMGVENPLIGGFVVDVRVETIDDKPTLYKILRYYERIQPE